MKKWILLAIVAILSPLSLLAQSTGLLTIEQAQQEGKYLFIFLFKAHDCESKKMEVVFDRAMKKAEDKSLAIKIDTQNQNEKAFINKFELECAPTPFVLALAPNGAITGGFPLQFSEEDLLNAFASPAVEQTLKALQEHKLVFLTIQGAHTAHNNAALAGINDFKFDSRFSNATVIVILDPLDKREEKFLKQIQIDPNIREATTILFAPPGQIVGKFTGPTNKEQLTKALEKAVSGCCPDGCCPGGCCTDLTINRREK